MAESDRSLAFVSADESSVATGRAVPRFETLTLLHLGALMIFISWAFGGNAGWARTAATWGASLGGLITVAALASGTVTAERRRMLHWLWPLGALTVYVILGALNPSYREVIEGNATYFVRDSALPRSSFLPSSARPDLSMKALWFFAAVYVSCFNLTLLVRRRCALRRLLAVVVVNGLVLGVFGTVQKLVGAKGLYFGLVPTVQPYFFSTFVYHNHWGAFAILAIAAAIGLGFHQARRGRYRDFWHSPALLGMVAVFFLASTIPLSTSRSCTVLVVALLCFAICHALVRSVRTRWRHGRSIAPPIGLGLTALVLFTAFTLNLSGDVIALRVNQTRQQLAQMDADRDYLPRAVLYRDTWRLAREKLWLGWGMASYPTAFYQYNSQHYSSDGPNRVFHDAHSDWLQSIAELGLIGSALVGLCGMVPLHRRWRGLLRSPICRYLLSGCALILLYAWLEFPFGNGAVVVAFWLCLFSAVTYHRLGGGQAASAGAHDVLDPDSHT